MNSSSWLRSFRQASRPSSSRIARRGNQQAMTFSTTPVVCLTLAKWETVSVSGQFGGYPKKGGAGETKSKTLSLCANGLVCGK